MQTRFLLGDWGFLFRVLLHGGNHILHPFLDFTNLRMQFFDEFMFKPGQFLNSFALFTKLIEKGILLGRDQVHPPKADTPADSPYQRHPKSEVVSVHV